MHLMFDVKTSDAGCQDYKDKELNWSSARLWPVHAALSFGGGLRRRGIAMGADGFLMSKLSRKT